MADDYVKGMLSSGEVVLIDTRQHWIAAVRYALRPIVILLLGGLLLVLNAWLDLGDWLNTLVSWAMWILLIIAVIWLPIDLVRWYSRKYVLTSRRAMRMSGVFKKKSFDSSLEQINDINLVQSVLGRAMNYADLTLYTASDTANETYDQLMDGVQFKKAVLDAKEALRRGAPATSLPEGFIVKGGTNVASMRADGKLQEAAAQDTAAPIEPDTLADQSTADMTSEAPVPAEPEPVVAAEPPEPEPEPAAPAPTPEPEPVAPAAAAEPEPVAAAESEPAAAPEPDPEPEAAEAAEPPAAAAEETDTSASAWPAADTAADTAAKQPTEEDDAGKPA